ncbi:major facilitator superfamily domain-containing protein 6 [Trichonephila clavipes]|nr:major facilitator superfamily domain-containing protein 6 [Trichonephila clavipes]
MPPNTHRVHTEYVGVKSVGPKVSWIESRVQGTGEYFPSLMFNAFIVEVETGGVTIYRKDVQPVSQALAIFIPSFREFHRAKSYCRTSVGTTFPYVPIFAKNRVGISATALASILTTQQFLVIFTKPLIGYIADYFNKLKVIIGILAVIQTIFFLLLLTVPKIQKEEQMTEIFHNETDLKSVFDHYNSTVLLVKCDFHQQNDIFSKKDTSSYNNSKNKDICFLQFDILSKFSDICSNYTTEINKLLSGDSSNVKDRSSTEISPISFEQQINYATTSKPLCTICCKVTGDCQNIECEAPKNDSNKVLIKKADNNDFKTYQFWLFAFLTIFGMMGTNAMFTLSDTACCESVQKFGTDFGRQRLWGAIGWGLMSPVGGVINDYTDGYAASWTLMSFMTVVALFNIRRLDLAKPQFSQNILKDVGLVLSSGEFLAFQTGVFMCGIGTGVTWFYLIWFLTTIGGSRFLCGMVQFVQCFVGEIPFMFFSGWMLTKIGHFNALTLALMSYCIRFFWYSQLYNPWLVLPTECLDGFTYGLFYVTVASYAKLSAKPGTEATTQAVLFTTHDGLGKLMLASFSLQRKKGEIVESAASPPRFEISPICGFFACCVLE